MTIDVVSSHFAGRKAQIDAGQGQGRWCKLWGVHSYIGLMMEFRRVEAGISVFLHASMTKHFTPPLCSFDSRENKSRSVAMNCDDFLGRTKLEPPVAEVPHGRGGGGGWPVTKWRMFN